MDRFHGTMTTTAMILFFVFLCAVSFLLSLRLSHFQCARESNKYMHESTPEREEKLWENICASRWQCVGDFTAVICRMKSECLDFNMSSLSSTSIFDDENLTNSTCLWRNKCYSPRLTRTRTEKNCQGNKKKQNWHFDGRLDVRRRAKNVILWGCRTRIGFHEKFVVVVVVVRGYEYNTKKNFYF